MLNNLVQTIEIDCAPGNLRPGDVMKSMIEELELPFKYKETSGRLFGNWTWTFNEFNEEDWRAIQKKVGPYLTKCWEKGTVRYASW